MKILLLGLGRANRPVARYCIERGDTVFLYEEDLENISSASREMISKRMIELHQEGNNYDLVVSSPGFPMHKDIIIQYQDRYVPIIDEIEFTYQELDNPSIIAVTGTNGKSTTAALIHTILDRAGIDSFLGGNLAPGNPFSQCLFERNYRYYVLEVSSFQLMRIKDFRPRIAVLTNIGSDHLNWHTSAKEYREAKMALFKNQRADDIAVLNKDDDTVRSLTKDLSAHRIYFGISALEGAHCNGSFCFGSEVLFPCSVVTLKGDHNIMNLLAAIAVCKALDIDSKIMEQSLERFKPLPHRLEDCGIYRGLRYINNSMCTNEQAAIASFKAVPGPKIVIVGGREKGDTAAGYLTLLTREAKKCIILGENAATITKFFKGMYYNDFAVAQSMDEAVRLARSAADEGDTIMLNPGFASFGLFRNFEERGEAFRNAARND